MKRRGFLQFLGLGAAAPLAAKAAQEIEKSAIQNVVEPPPVVEASESINECYFSSCGEYEWTDCVTAYPSFNDMPPQRVRRGKNGRA